jgi:NADPH-dependent 7-cyano-7-deazaguanine reductase QueF-like protein
MLKVTKVIRYATVVATISCSHGALTPDLSLVQPYSYDLEHKEPYAEQPFLSHFKKGNKNIVYIAARHQNTVDSKTFKLIDKGFDDFRVNCVILEGVEFSIGESPESLLKNYKLSNDGVFYKWGETSYTAIKASEIGVPFIGAEPDEGYILKTMIGKGYKIEDVFFFYFVRQLPQYERNMALETKSLPELFHELMEQYIKKNSLNLLESKRLSFEVFLNWYKQKNHKVFNFQSFDPEEAAPLSDGVYFTQRVSSEIGLIRDRHIVQVICNTLIKYDCVLVVFGKSHLATQRNFIETMMGKAIEEYTL